MASARGIYASGMEYGAPIPEPYDDPGNWPFRWCDYSDARGWVTRLRSAGSREGKLIAKEVGVSARSVRRAVRWYLLSVGEYEPDSWLAYERKRKAEGRRYFLELMAKRDELDRNVSQQTRGAGHAHHERATRDEDLHIATSYSEDSDRQNGDDSYNAS